MIFFDIVKMVERTMFDLFGVGISSQMFVIGIIIIFVFYNYIGVFTISDLFSQLKL